MAADRSRWCMLLSLAVISSTVMAFTAGCGKESRRENPGGPQGIAVVPPPAADWLVEHPEGTASDPSSNAAVTETERQIALLEQRRRHLLPLLESAEEEKTELIAKLKAVGIQKSTDLKNNPSARRLAIALQRISLEIRRMHDEIGRLDEGIALAYSLQRRAEQDKVRISDAELAALTVGTPPEPANADLDPINLDVLLKSELTGESTPGIPRFSSTARLVGHWEILKTGWGGSRIYLEFTRAGSVIFRVPLVESIGSYTLQASRLTLTDRRGRSAVYVLDFAADGKTVLFRAEQSGSNDFDGLEGRWSRSQSR